DLSLTRALGRDGDRAGRNLAVLGLDPHHSRRFESHIPHVIARSSTTGGGRKGVARVGPTTPKHLGAVILRDSMVTSIQTRIELRSYFPAASVDQTEAHHAKVTGIVWVRPPACRAGRKCRPAKPVQSVWQELHPRLSFHRFFLNQ